MRARSRVNREHGFTLLEVLVALAVLATAMGAIIKGGAEGAAGSAYLRDKTFASWVAQNRVTELQVTHQWLSGGTQQGQEELAGVHWYWEMRALETADPNVQRLEIGVAQSRAALAHPLIHLVAFLARKGEG